MRVIAGRWGGRRLKSIRARDLRPVTDRVKGAVFSALGEAVVGAQVLDLFSGVGSFGIEALSRGASRVIFVDLSARVLRVLEENLRSLGCWEQSQVVQGDVFKFLKRFPGHLPPVDIVFADPPFEKAWGLRLLQNLAQLAVLKRGGIFVYKHHVREGISHPPRRFSHLKDYSFGETVVSFFMRIEEDENSHLPRNL